jgi:hypothetical protein
MKHILTIVVILLAGHIKLMSQSSPSYTVVSDVRSPRSAISGAVLSLPVTNKVLLQPQVLKERNAFARLHLKLDLGDDYVIPSTGVNTFTVEVNLNYSIGSAPPVSKTLMITHLQPEYLIMEDVFSSFNVTGTSPPITVHVTAVSTTDAGVPLPAGFLDNLIAAKLRLTAKLERGYDVDVRLKNSGLMYAPPVANPVSITHRLVTFNWSAPGVDAYPDYELQILKVFNTDPLYKNNLNEISAKIDWSNALKVETQSYKTSFKLTMAEGTGYYIWRVRPVGNYYQGGISNSENYGQWSYSFQDGATTVLNKNNLLSSASSLPYAFYFTDPDENINWIYSRVFTEGDNDDPLNPKGTKSSEGMNYADGLLNVRQSQKYNSSDVTTIVSQTISDYSGRPALTTLPVPVVGNLEGYKTGFVKSTSNDLYRAKMFDENANENAPQKIKDDASSAYGYYSSNAVSGVSNKNVPDAEGYPFTRTKFNTDGTGRVVEESGIGKVHALGLQTNNQGRTTRIAYGSPSDEQLIRVFGDEAPLSESVIMTVTTDPNNVQSVAYTSKEGKTIATALITASTTALQSLETDIEPLTVRNTINQNTIIDGKIIASKRFVFTNATNSIKLSYEPGTFPGGSACAGGDCNLEVRFYIVDIKNSKTYVSDADASLSGNQAFKQTSLTNVFPAGWKFVHAGGNIIPSGANNNSISLPAGEYLFVKEIGSGNRNNAEYADSIVSVQNNAVMPLITAVTDKMQSVSTPAAYTAFITWHTTLRTKIISYHTTYSKALSDDIVNFLNIDFADLPGTTSYTVPASFDLPALTTSTTNPGSSNLEISTGCCGKMTVPVPKPDICLLCEGDPDLPVDTYPDMTLKNNSALNAAINNPATYTALTPYGIEDFRAVAGFNALNTRDQRDAIRSLVDLEFILPLKDKMDEEGISHTDLWKIAPGFSFERLNFMISNMLLSKYYTGYAAEIGGTWYAMKKNDDGQFETIGTVASQTLDYNYKCKKLYESWQNAVLMINSFDADGGGNIVDDFNAQDGNNSAQNEADDDGNWDDDSKRKKGILSFLISRKMKNFSDSDDGKLGPSKVAAITSLVSNFMEFAGYQYAAIIDGEALPGYVTETPAHLPADYTTAPTFTFVPAASPTHTVISMSGETIQNIPVIFKLNSGVAIAETYTCVSTGTPRQRNELYYDYVVKPEWMFKYYVYNAYEEVSNPANIIPDADAVIANQVMFEINDCYKTADKYVSSAHGYNSSLPLCRESCTASYKHLNVVNNFNLTHVNWSLEERIRFYKEIRGSAKCYELKGETSPTYNTPNPLCPTKATLVAEAKAEVDLHISQLGGFALSVKQALMNELASSCYTIVPCSTGLTGEITEKEVDLMVSKVIDNCTLQLNTIKDKFNFTATERACNSSTAATNAYGDNETDFPYIVLTGCQDVLLTDQNTLTVIPSTTMQTHLFADCDLKIISMLEQGTFLPYIEPLPGCIKPKPSYIDPVAPCVETNCDVYSEKTLCTEPSFKKYSKTYSVSAQ